MSELPPSREVTSRTDDLRIRGIQQLVAPCQLLDEIALDAATADVVCATRATISDILAGRDKRLLVVVGPCSIHNVAAALEYAEWLSVTTAGMRDRLVTVMRVYFEKPRTRHGWKGLINDPYLDGSFKINDGLRLARKLLVDINRRGVPTATEFVDPITPQYVADLISWAAIGARTSESQVHRELASALSCPVGFKNGTSGDLRVAVNAVLTARGPHRFLSVTKTGAAAIVSTAGNTDCHIILRGGIEPNYDEASIAAAAGLLNAEGLSPRVMVDCSHGNCAGDYRRQVGVAEEIARQVDSGSPHICGVMVESNLLPGRQLLGSGEALLPGQSVTDACIGCDDTRRLLDCLAGSGVWTRAAVTAW
jgi:3-deoxy-7-phosphoheptulonate synthase